MRWGLLWLGIAGCSFHPSDDLAGGPDAAPDAEPDAIPCVGFSSQLDTCAHVAGPDLTLDGTVVFDTDTGVLTDNGVAVPVTTALVTTTTNQVEVRALLVGALVLTPQTSLRATGSRPFAIVASAAVQVGTAAVIDVAVGGAGARPTCMSGAIAGAADSGGGAGGGGGGFGGVGGKGGNGDSDGGQSTGGAGGSVTAAPTGPLGGCSGADGGLGGDPGGAGALGGGAIYIVSAIEIDLASAAGITAGGGGGGGGMKLSSQYGDAGGGGGGSGGLILLEAPHVHSTGTLAANGGGGGEGSGNGSAGRPGTPGALGVDRANGGATGSPTGTDGGKGGAGSMTAGDPPSNVQAGGGGGGGGGVGFVRVVSADRQLGALVSPAAI